jgi:predicted nucleic acid-binding protein
VSIKQEISKKTFYREVTAPTMLEALKHTDDFHRGFYDMLVIAAYPAEHPEGFMTVMVFGWENKETRENLSV